MEIYKTCIKSLQFSGFGGFAEIFLNIVSNQAKSEMGSVLN